MVALNISEAALAALSILLDINDDDEVLAEAGVDPAALYSLRKQLGGPCPVKHPEIEVQLSGADGNAFAVMGAVQKALRRGGVPKEERDAYTAESVSGDYDNLLRVAMEWVTVL